MSFKNDFLWGAATAAYQIEGAAFEDGKGLSIWDSFSHTKGKTYLGHNGDIACDDYHRLEEDLDILSSLGIKSYRFSVSWSRIIPNGTGKINEKGIEFYSRLIDGLIKRGITPCLTLFHWDLPYALHLKGGWLNDESPDWFAEFAAVIKKYFGDRVHLFITLNEPQAFVGNGYCRGNHAPGYKLGKSELMRICHNVLKAHGRAVVELRKGEQCKIGIAAASTVRMPLSVCTADIEAARSDYFSSNYDDFVCYDAYWLDPIIKGKYPDWVYDYKDITAPEITDEDMKLISQPIDFIGMNIYSGIHVSEVNGQTEEPQGSATTLFGWAVTPDAMYWGPKFYWERYNKPIFITENGMACHDRISSDGCVHDPNRTDYIISYLSELKRAAEEGIEIYGYYAWSLLDNIEWEMGYKERFGIVYVDYTTQKRTIKDSGFFYKKIIESNGDIL